MIIRVNSISKVVATSQTRRCITQSQIAFPWTKQRNIHHFITSIHNQTCTDDCSGTKLGKLRDTKMCQVAWQTQRLHPTSKSPSWTGPSSPNRQETAWRLWSLQLIIYKDLYLWTSLSDSLQIVCTRKEGAGDATDCRNQSLTWRLLPLFLCQCVDSCKSNCPLEAVSCFFIPDKILFFDHLLL